MIMMRSTGTTKMGKPPPPVPPRPNKTLVAEALAKTRKENPSTTPNRTAPPPPPPTTVSNSDITKSKSCVSVNLQLKKPVVVYERSISEEVKCNSTRPVVYQSANLKRKDSDNRKNIEVRRIDSFTKDVNNWDKMLNDRNHVNTLIDEMFASVLSVPGIEVAANTNNIQSSEEIVESSPEISSSTDKTQITINNNVMEPYVCNNSSNCSNSSGEDKISSTVIVIKDSTSVNEKIEEPEIIPDSPKSNSSTVERKNVKFNDQMNHELLISELQNMKKDQEKILKRQRKPSMNFYDASDSDVVPPKVCSDWVEMNGVGDNEEDNLLSTCHITIEDLNSKITNNGSGIVDYKRISKMSSLHGLPPLPKSLSGFNLLDNPDNPPTPIRSSSMRSGQTTTTTTLPSSGNNHLVYPKAVNGTPTDVPQTTTTGRKSTNLDTQLAILRREMYSLRQLDLSLLGQLWSLNESIQDFRMILQEQDDRVLSPPSPSPSPSSGDEGEGDDYYMSTSSISFRPAPPPPPVRRPSSSSNASSIHEER